MESDPIYFGDSILRFIYPEEYVYVEAEWMVCEKWSLTLFEFLNSLASHALRLLQDPG